jgi:hypothetical protein
MEKNKHILLFEAFASNTLSKTISFLDKEIGKNQRIEFLLKFKEFLGKYDVPLDKIDDVCFDYLNKKDAIEVRNIEPVTNSEGVYCFKFWFSTDKGYLGHTYTGNITKKESTNKKKSDLDVEFKDIESVGIKTGTIKTLSDFRGLKTGDTIYGIFSSDYDQEFKKAIIYIDSGDRVYAIQDGSSGTAPIESEWRKYGRNCWIIGRSPMSKSDDNYKLCLHQDDGKELNIDGVTKKKNIILDPVSNPMEFNLPMYGKFAVSWEDRNNSIRDGLIKMADFAIILYYDKLISLNLEKPSELRSQRTENRKDAYALLKNEEIKRANINRYMDKICIGLGLNYKNELNPRNLQRLVSKILNGNLSLMYIGWRDARIKIQRLVEDIYQLIYEYNNCSNPITDSQKGRIEERYLLLTNRIKEYFNDRILSEDRSRLLELIKKLENNPDTFKEEIKILEKLISIGDYISRSISRSSINSIEDLRIAEIKIATIKNVMTDDYLRLTPNVRNLLESLRYSSGDSYYNIMQIRNSEGYKKANDKIDLLDRYIKSISF